MKYKYMKANRLIICIIAALSTINVFSTKTTPVVISEVFYDSPLNEDCRLGLAAHHNGEFIELFNPTTNDINISGWVLWDNTTAYALPANTILPARSLLLVAYQYPGSNFDITTLFPKIKEITTPKTILYQSSIMLSNNGELLSLYNNSGYLIDQMSYRHRSTFGSKSGYWDITASNGSNDNYKASALLSLQRFDIHYSSNGITPLASDYTSSLPTPLEISIANDLPVINEIYDAASIDTSLPVGNLPGQATVSLTGAATYQIPIEVPSGTNGQQPQLSVVYNSQGGFGALGRGWDISATSIIKRVPQNLYYDGKSGTGVQFSDEDRLTLDDQRLILLSGNNLQENAIYATEVENYSRVKIVKSTVTGDIAFELTTKDGRTIEYGNTQDSRLTNAAYTTRTDKSVLAWKINLSKDVYNNSIQYSYDSYGQYLDQIKYVGTTGNFQNTIKFNYYSNQLRGSSGTGSGGVTDRTTGGTSGGSTGRRVSRSGTSPYTINEINTYIKSFLIKQDKVLASITISSNENKTTANSSGKIKEYQFAYIQSDIDLRLNTVTSLTGDGSKISTSKINWGADKSATTPSLVTLAAMSDKGLNTVDNSALYTGDIDGDGKLDKIEVWYGSRSKNEKGWFQVVSANNTLLYKVEFDAFDPFTPYFFYSEPKSRTKIAIADFNNDGKDEIFLWDAKTQNVYIYGKSANDVTIIPKVPFSFTPLELFVTNLNDDEYPDVFMPYVYLGNRYVCFNGNSNKLDESAGLRGYDSKDPQRISLQTGDFNADGKLDIVGINNESFSDNNYNNKVDFFYSTTWGNELLDGSARANKRYSKCFPIDYNNDGLTDLLCQYANDKDLGNPKNGWFLLKNNGGCSTKPEKIALDFPTVYNDQGKDERYEAYLVDYNGDGYTDVVIGDEVFKNKTDFRYTNWYFYKNTGNGFAANGTAQTNTRLSKMNAVNMDINNDGVQDLVFGAGDNYAAFTLPNASSQFLVQSITDGVGLSNVFTYNNVSNQAATTSPTNVRNLKRPIMLVSSYTDKDGSVTNYEYGAAKMHTKGKGFLGFESITTTTPRLGLKTTTTYEIDSKCFGLYLKSQQVDVIGGGRASYSSQVNRIIDGNEKTNPIQKGKKRDNGTDGINRYLPIVSSSSSIDDIKGITQSSESKTFDANWNVTKQAETRGDAKKITEATYIARISGGPLYLPSQITVTQQRTGQPDIATETDYSGYNTAGQPGKKTVYPKTNGEIVSDYTYYTTGNLHTVTVTPKNCPPQKTTYNYTNDTYYRLVSSETTSFNSGAKISDKTTSSTYDFATGNVLTKTGINGQTTTYKYDKFGQLSKEIHPNGEEISYSTTWDSNHGALYKKTATNKLITNTSTVYYDWQGREVYTEQTGWEGATLISSKEYTNTRGQLTKAIKPHYAGETEIYTKYEYVDDLGRPTKESAFDGAHTNITTYGYNTHTTTIIPPDTRQVKTITTDAQELVIKRTDAGGEITYEYDAAGKPRYITSNNSITEIRYDNYGNQSTLVDPNAGTSSYTYYADGKLKTQTNAKGDYTEIVYDDAGRMDTKTVTEHSSGTITETKNTYVDSGNGIGQVSTITMKVGSVTTHTQTFAYNNHQQVESATEVYDGQTAIFSYGYDSKWRPETTTSPSGLVTTNVYNEWGDIYQVKTGSTVAWEGKKQNGNGQFTNFTLGNGLETNRSYSDRGEITGITTNFPKTTTNYVQNNTYGYDATSGNLLTRNDVSNSRNEVFTYDALDRLTNATLNGTTTYTMTYQGNGNIDTKTDVGTYKYTNGRPHAMSGIDGVQTGVSSDKQFIDYTSFEKVSRIQQGVDATSITKQYNIYYGLDEERIKSVYTNGSAIQTRYYFGSYEKTIKPDGSTEETDYIYTPTGLTALQKSGTLYYVHTDHMSSLQAITNGAGTIVTSYAYTAWGERKLLSGDNTITDRGYTGHEHLEAFGLINMNGRVYDPVLARFLSPDPYAQPDNTQGFNRYAYCLNNPFRYSDPSGNNPLLIGALIGGAINLVSQIASGNVSNLGDAFKAFGVGALAGLVGAGVGTLVAGAVKIGGFAAGALIGGAGGAAGGFVGGAGNAWINGSNFNDGLVAGLKGGAMGALMGGVTGGLMRGIQDANNGFDFWNGDGTGEDILLPPNGNNTSQTEIEQLKSLNNPDNVLKSQIKTEYNIQEGDVKISRITLEKPADYTYTTDKMKYVNLKGQTVLGHTRPNSSGYTSVHISKYAANLYHSDIYTYKSIVGHELIHAYHYSIGLSGSYSDVVAYKYTINQLQIGGHTSQANAYLYQTVLSGFNGEAPIQYQIPQVLSFYH